MEYEFPFGTFRPEKQGYLFKYFIATENLPLERPKKSCSIHYPTAYPPNRAPGLVHFIAYDL